VGQTSLSLDEAVRQGAQYLQGRFPQGTRAAIVAIKSESPEIGEYTRGKLSSALVNSNWFIVVERSTEALGRISQEMDRHLNFEVSQETELGIGKQLGAEIIISGSIARLGQNWQMEIQGLWVESAQLGGQWSASQVRPEPSWASLAPTRSAAVSFAGDAMSPRDRQTVVAGLRNAMQANNIALDLDDSSSVGAGYGFTVDVYYNWLPPTFPANTTVLQAEVTVSFSQGLRVLYQTGPYYITEATEAMAARRVAERLSSDQAFFGRVRQAASN
jgi:hypothetical protein